jgi:uncharacterized protein
MRFKIIAFFLVIIGLLATPGVLFAYSSPGRPTGFVNDYADVLTGDQENALETKLEGFEASSTAEIAVVTIKTLGDDTIEDYAQALFKEWGIGKKGKDNGALVLVAVDDHQMRSLRLKILD